MPRRTAIPPGHLCLTSVGGMLAPNTAVEATMPSKPNYNFQRAERDRAKKAKKEEKLQEKRQQAARGAELAPEVAGEPTPETTQETAK